MQCDRSFRPQETKYATVAIDRVKLDGTFSGYASVFSKVDLGNDIILPGAFSRSLKHKPPGDIRMLFQHDPNCPIGVWTQIIEDKTGLWATGKIASNVHKGAEVLELMRAGAIDGLSIGFKTASAKTDPITKVRKIHTADLWEISVVTFPMHEDARISSVKNANGAGKHGLPSIREFEKWLTRDAGLTRAEAHTVIQKGFANLESTRDAAFTSEKHLAAAIRSAAVQLSTRSV